MGCVGSVTLTGGETEVALNLKKYGLILRESDLGSGHRLGHCCDRIQNRQEILGSTRDVLWWLLRCGRIGQQFQEERGVDSRGIRADESGTETGCSPLGRSSA